MALQSWACGPVRIFKGQSVPHLTTPGLGLGLPWPPPAPCLPREGLWCSQFSWEHRLAPLQSLAQSVCKALWSNTFTGWFCGSGHLGVCCSAGPVSA